jgi:hypothetical protein
MKLFCGLAELAPPKSKAVRADIIAARQRSGVSAERRIFE